MRNILAFKIACFTTPAPKIIKPAPEKPPAPPEVKEKVLFQDKALHKEKIQTPLIRRRFEAVNINLSQKIKVEDVKYVPKVLSPLDELRYMNLISFRRLDKEASVAAEKIKDEINLLVEESYGKKLEGIRLWRTSPIHKLYLEIGHLSISENKPVDVIIEERKMQGKEYLTPAEFKVIMDLNKSLRF